MRDRTGRSSITEPSRSKYSLVPTEREERHCIGQLRAGSSGMKGKLVGQGLELAMGFLRRKESNVLGTELGEARIYGNHPCRNNMHSQIPCTPTLERVSLLVFPDRCTHTFCAEILVKKVRVKWGLFGSQWLFCAHAAPRLAPVYSALQQIPKIHVFLDICDHLCRVLSNTFFHCAERKLVGFVFKTCRCGCWDRNPLFVQFLLFSNAKYINSVGNSHSCQLQTQQSFVTFIRRGWLEIYLAEIGLRDSQQEM